MKKLLLGFVAAATLTATSAVAADMPVYKAPPVITVYNWSGFYTASTLGIGWTRERGDYVLPPPDKHNSNQSLAWYDSHIGFQWQFSSIVVGVEATWATPLSKSWASTASPTADCFGATPIPNRLCESRISSVWGVGGRLGMAWDRVMAYGTAGWASAKIETRDSIASTGVINISEADTYRHGGWYAGAGVDWFATKFLFSDLIIGVEYRHYQFGTVRHFPSAPGTPAPVVVNADTRDVRGSLDTISLRATFKWTPGAAVIAKY